AAAPARFGVMAWSRRVSRDAREARWLAPKAYRDRALTTFTPSRARGLKPTALLCAALLSDRAVGHQYSHCRSAVPPTLRDRLVTSWLGDMCNALDGSAACPRHATNGSN